MGTVLVTSSASEVTDHELGLVKPVGEGVSHPVEYDAVYHMIARLAPNLFANIRVTEISDSRILVAYDRNLSHELPNLPKVERDQGGFGWVYVIERDPAADETDDTVARLAAAITRDYPHIIVQSVLLEWVKSKMGS